MTLAAMRAALKATLDAVPGIGRTYDYWRLVQHQAEVQADYVSSGKLHVWFLSLADDEPFTESRYVGCSRVVGKFWLHGYYALDAQGESEKDFEGIAQAVLTAFRADAQLAGAAIDSGPMRIKEAGHRQFCDVTCHYVQMETTVLAQVDTNG